MEDQIGRASDAHQWDSRQPEDSSSSASPSAGRSGNLLYDTVTLLGLGSRPSRDSGKLPRMPLYGTVMGDSAGGFVRLLWGVATV